MEALLRLMKNCGAADAGAVPLAALLPRMSAAARRRAEAELPQVGSLLVGVFPYFTDFQPGDIALYARGMDYHIALNNRLAAAARQMARDCPGKAFKVYVDASPYPEVLAAALSGLGALGRNGLLITPRHGSLVFIGVIATTVAFGGGGQLRFCQGCGRCVRACPMGALSDGRPDTMLCLSQLTQLRGALSAAQEAAIAQNGMVWGCDACQKACPMNRDLPVTDIPEFRSDLIRNFPPEDAGLTQRAFREKYADRAFSWRGVGPLRRNVRILGEPSATKGYFFKNTP